MTENQIKELISKNFIRTIANRHGYKIRSDEDLDEGVDLAVIEVAYRKNNDGSIRYYNSGRQIELQLKCTTENSVDCSNNAVKYILNVKNYNDLINRRNTHFPLVLIVFILPADSEKWVYCDENMLKVEKHAFWYLPEIGEKESDNKNNITLNIPKENIVTKHSFGKLLDFIYS